MLDTKVEGRWGRETGGPIPSKYFRSPTGEPGFLPQASPLQVFRVAGDVPQLQAPGEALASAVQVEGVVLLLDVEPQAHVALAGLLAAPPLT